MKKVQIGARISEEDAEFLHLLNINGATSPSDKLRAIIEEARIRREFSQDFSGLYRQVQEQVSPLAEKIKKIEFEQGIHSTLLARIFEWLPDFYAYCLCSLPDEIESEQELVDFEKGAIDRMARLIESLLHQELSSQETSYTPDVFKSHVSSFADLIKIINVKSQKAEEENT